MITPLSQSNFEAANQLTFLVILSVCVGAIARFNKWFHSKMLQAVKISAGSTRDLSNPIQKLLFVRFVYGFIIFL